MAGDASSQTSSTLLGRLRQDRTDEAAWAEFVGRYGPKVYQWCCQRKLQDADAQDVTQDVLLKLAERMRTFVYDSSKSFRGWLRTLTEHALSDFLKDRKPADVASGDSTVMELLGTIPARDDLIQRLDEEFDRELYDEAAAKVRLRFERRTWDAFCLTAIDGLSGAAAAKKLNMTIAAVYMAKSKVRKALKEEIARLEANISF